MTQHELKLESYPLNETQTKPISFILPFLKDVKSVKMADCNLTDAAAALVVASVLGNSATKVLDLRGIEMGKTFIASLEKAIETDPGCLEELALEGLRPQISISNLINTLRPTNCLAYFDLQKNSLSEAVALDIGDFVQHSRTLEYLNLSSCGLRRKASEHVINGLMKNRSIKYLNLNANSLSSSDHLLAAKAGRMLQGHPRLLHVNLSHC